jgi:8-oxo-dGTP pyrophosphatase MutT (NUDIX family)
VIVLGPGEKVLLFHYSAEATADGEAFWLTPGGGIKPGEKAAEAAVRELAEEAGIVTTLAELGSVVAESRGQWSDGDTVYDAHDSFFFLRVDSDAVNTDGQEELERSLCRDHRWWGLGELAASDETVWPIELTQLARRLEAGEHFTVPANLSWR